MDKIERRICWYSSLLIVILISTPKLLALRPDGIIAHYWHFNLGELLFQDGANLLYCWLLFELNLNLRSPVAHHLEAKKYTSVLVYNGALFLVYTGISGGLQQLLFDGQKIPLHMLWLGSLARTALVLLLIGILINIILLLRASKKKDLENEQLKTAYMATELELLKEQINPHFLFNSLSSLSGVIRENPELAQKYVKELSNVFRYTLVNAKANLVTVHEELTMLRSFAQLITMRLEDAFQLNIDVPDAWLLHKLPHLSLQPLLENAVKHNAFTVKRPLKVCIFIENDKLVVSNSIWEIPVPDTSNGLGLVNLNERYKIMTRKEIEISKTGEQFTVKLPLTL